MILQIDPKNNSVIGTFESIADAARSLGLDGANISRVTRGLRQTCGGFKWVVSKDHSNNEDRYADNISYEYKNEDLNINAKISKSIKTLEDAIEYFDIDLDKWYIPYFKCNVWESKDKGSRAKLPLHQVKLTLRRKPISFEDCKEEIDAVLTKYKPKPIVRSSGNGVLSVELADFHIGANVTDLYRTKDFNLGILRDYLVTVSEIVNGYGADSVYINMHGDFIESITGLNHDDSWKSMASGMYGAEVLMVAHRLLSGDLIGRIKNVSCINMVSGNHDRISSKKSVDNYGEAAKILHYMLSRDFPEIETNYDSLILVKEIDGINHIMTHGHHGISKKDLAKVISDYGVNSMFNLWTEGHYHSRHYTKVLKTSLAKYDTVDYVLLDDMNYRKLRLPSLFTGNFFSESLGYAGNAGVVITYNNGNGIPNIDDKTI